MYKSIGTILLLCLFDKHCLAFQNKVTLVTEHLPPYQIVDNNTFSVTGFATEMVLEVVERSAIEYDLQAYPWVRTYNLALKKSNHCIFSLARLPSREKLFTWIGRITEKNNTVIWSLKSNNNAKQIKKIEDLKHYVTAVTRNDASHTGMLNLNLIENKNLYVLHHTQSLIKLLVERPEIDFIVADDITIPYRAKLAGISMDLLKRVIELKNLPLNFYLACNIKSDKVIIEKLTKSLADIHQDGTYQKILTKWIDEMPYLLH
ncbi:MAG: transporter substrate-binding domain-containing protein [Litorilituus sp.]|jgi:polar amino acid transport system substrate-binding protein|nr:transporter substrate-binding domain-containing protein [Litorilituus sp.]